MNEIQSRKKGFDKIVTAMSILSCPKWPKPENSAGISTELYNWQGKVEGINGKATEKSG